MKKFFTFLVLLLFLVIPSHAQLNYHQGDVNGDGTIDISDVVSLVNMIMNGETTLNCPDDHHPHAVDLGLPSGTLWACCNVDAPSPEGYGGYFAWGETGVKLVYDWNTYTLCNGTESSCQDIGTNIGRTTYDVAHEKWGGFWWMPSSAQFQELLDNCDSEWTMVNGVYGRMFTGKNGSSIFFPSAGFREGPNLSLCMNYGIYWSGTKASNDNSRARYLQFSASTTYLIDNPRYAGFPVRPVNVVSYLTCPDDHHPHRIDLGLPSGTLWSCCNLGAGTPESYGRLYAWGETETKTNYNQSTYIYYDSISGYQNLGSDIAGTEYDVAHMEWKGDWQMPSKEQIEELISNCTFKWIIINGSKAWQGGRFTSNINGGSIYLPAAGYSMYGRIYLPRDYGYYWSSTQSPSNSGDACILCFHSSNAWGGGFNRARGLSVRPVSR